MIVKTVKDYRGFWGKWTLASATGFMIGGMLAIPIAYGLGEIVADATNESVGFVFVGAFFGLFVGGGFGLGQQIVLQFTVGLGRKWALISALAGAIALAVAFPLLISTGDSMSTPAGAAMAILFGLALGTGQWYVLREYMPQASRWVLVTTASLTLALGVALSLDGEGRELLSFGIGALLAGALTGLGMAWLMRDSASAS